MIALLAEIERQTEERRRSVLEAASAEAGSILQRARDAVADSVAARVGEVELELRGDSRRRLALEREASRRLTLGARAALLDRVLARAKEMALAQSGSPRARSAAQELERRARALAPDDATVEHGPGSFRISAGSRLSISFDWGSWIDALRPELESLVVRELGQGSHGLVG